MTLSHATPPSLFPDDDRLFGVAPGQDFSDTFIAGLLERLAGSPPEVLARVEVFTNTRRARRHWESLLRNGPAQLLPRIHVVSELSQDPTLGPVADLAEPPIATRLRLTQLVRRLLEVEKGLAPPIAAYELAGSLTALMDEMAEAGIPPEALGDLDIADASNHWQTALKFLTLISGLWDGDQQAPALGTEARQALAVDALAARWAASPPAHPVIVAGSTGSRGPTAALMQAVLRLPQGGVVLPGFDFDLNARSWRALSDPDHHSPDHPQTGFAALLQRLDLTPQAITPWQGDTRSTPRTRLVSLALRPAPVTDEWRRDGPGLLPDVAPALDGVSLLNAPSERAEAAAIAVSLRQTIDTGGTAALITPDGTLARRVTAALDRWGILPDDSAGRPLPLIPEGVFTSLVLDFLISPAPVTLTALLKHPLCAQGWDRGAHLRLIRHLDIDVLRDCGPVVNWDAVTTWAAKKEGGPPWAAWLRDTLCPIPPADALDARAACHRLTAEALASGPGLPPATTLWTNDQGRATARILTRMAEATADAGPMTWRDYAAVFHDLLSAEKLRPEGYVPDQRVLIWGQLEARVQSADLIVLGGLNEGTWPAQPPADPWLSRDMRRQLGLPMPEKRIGLAAHDFQQAACAPRVVLSRSARLDNTPTVPSRWLVRLENLVAGLGPDGTAAWKAATARGDTLIATAEAQDTPTETLTRAPRPCPVIPVDKRPNRISVTQVETLVRDPYAFYAAKVLKLRALPRSGRAPDGRDRGTALHLVLERFLKATFDGLPDDAEAAFQRILADTMAGAVPWPAQRRIWQARLARIAADFIAQERLRRSRARPAEQEVLREVSLPGLARDVYLTAKADRIDLTDTGEVAIYDYKSTLPTDKQALLFQQQLPLEAKMASLGAFLEQTARRAVHLELIGLSKPGQALELDSDPETIEEVWARFLQLVEMYEEPDRGYPSRLRPHKQFDAGDYDHLARRGEWADGDIYEPEDLS